MDVAYGHSQKDFVASLCFEWGHAVMQLPIPLWEEEAYKADGYTIFHKGLGDKQPTWERLNALNLTDLENIVAVANAHYGTQLIQQSLIRNVVNFVLKQYSQEAFSQHD